MLQLGRKFMNFYLGLFSNRTETLDFAKKLKSYRIDNSVVAVPKGVGSSCGVCVKIPGNQFVAATKVLKANRYATFLGFYEALTVNGGAYEYRKVSFYNV